MNLHHISLFIVVYIWIHVCCVHNFVQIFTNSDENHAIKVLDKLGIRDCFEQIICFETMNPNLNKTNNRPHEIPVILKPSLEAINIAIDAAEVDPRRTVINFLTYVY